MAIRGGWRRADTKMPAVKAWRVQNPERPSSLRRPQGIPHMHQPGLHKAFHPAGPLPQPVYQLRIGFLTGET